MNWGGTHELYSTLLVLCWLHYQQYFYYYLFITTTAATASSKTFTRLLPRVKTLADITPDILPDEIYSASRWIITVYGNIKVLHVLHRLQAMTSLDCPKGGRALEPHCDCVLVWVHVYVHACVCEYVRGRCNSTLEGSKRPCGMSCGSRIFAMGLRVGGEGWVMCEGGNLFWCACTWHRIYWFKK